MLFNKQLQWEAIITNFIQITIDSSLGRFQYKYLMNIIPNNKNLFKYGIVEFSLCDLCSMSVETNMQLFWNCHYVHIFGTTLRHIQNTNLAFVLISNCLMNVFHFVILLSTIVTAQTVSILLYYLENILYLNANINDVHQFFEDFWNILNTK